MTGVVYDDIFLKHDLPNHPENAERLRLSVEHLKAVGIWDKLVKIPLRQATTEQITAVHVWGYIQKLKKICREGGGKLDEDTHLTPDSFEVATFAAGGVIAACDAVLTKKVSNAIALVRPPGHHATQGEGMGFCLLNNVAIATKYMQSAYGLSRVGIVDWDAHHGNGTQEIFYADPTVFYVSLHRFPFYPGTGSAREVGTGSGAGLTKNVPVRFGVPTEEVISRFRAAIERYLLPFRPQIIIISAGFDGFADDPVAGLNLWPEEFATFTEIVAKVARRSAGGRIVSALEGGYSKIGLPACLEQHINVLLAQE